MLEKERVTVSVVIPTFNRPYLLKEVYEQVKQAISSSVTEYEVIFVDDSGSKRNYEVLSSLVAKAKEGAKIKAIILKGHWGQQNATLAGIRQARFDYVLTLDDDLEYDLSVIPELFKEMQQGMDVAYAVPLEEMKTKRRVYRQFGTYLKEAVFCYLLAKPKEIQLTSYRLMNRKTVDYVSKDLSKSVYLSARILQGSNKISNIRMKRNTQQKMVSGYNLSSLSKLLWKTFLQYNQIRCLRRFKKQGIQYEIKEIIQ